MNSFTASLLWPFIRVSAIFFSHFLTLPLMDYPKKDMRHPGLIWAGSFLALEAISAIVLVSARGLTGLSGSILLIVSTIAFGATFTAISAGPAFRSLFIFASYCTYYMFAAGLSKLLSDHLFSDSSGLAMTIILSLISAVYYIVLRLYLSRRFGSLAGNIRRGWRMLFAYSLIVFAAVSFIIMLILFFLPPYLHLNIAIYGVMFILVTISFVIEVKVISILNEDSLRTALRAQSRNAENELDLELHFREIRRQLMNDLLSHDIRILHFLENGQYDDAAEYISEHMRIISAGKEERQSGNTAVNAYMELAMRRCDHLGIRFTADCDIPEQIPLSENELGIIFGNIFENAIEAAIRTEDPFISFYAARSGPFLSAEIRNSMNGPVSFREGFPIPERPDGGSGLGLRNVQLILESHEGLIACSASGDIFITRILLPLK